MNAPKFELSIRCDNDAFGETDAERGAEIARILRELADRYENGERYHDGTYPYYQNAHDVSGNVVGTYRLAEVEVRS